MKRKMKMNKKYFGFAIAVVLVGIIGFFVGSVTAQTRVEQSHPASEITPGTFRAGDYTFQHWSKITGENRLDIWAQTLMLGTTNDFVRIRLNADDKHPNAMFTVGTGTMEDVVRDPNYQDLLTVDTSGNLWVKGTVNLAHRRIYVTPFKEGDKEDFFWIWNNANNQGAIGITKDNWISMPGVVDAGTLRGEGVTLKKAYLCGSTISKTDSGGCPKIMTWE